MSSNNVIVDCNIGTRLTIDFDDIEPCVELNLSQLRVISSAVDYIHDLLAAINRGGPFYPLDPCLADLIILRSELIKGINPLLVFGPYGK